MTDQGTTFFILAVLTLAVILLIFGMKYFAAGRTARLRSDQETALADAHKSNERVQAEILAALGDVRAAGDDLKRRVASIETMLKEVG